LAGTLDKLPKPRLPVPNVGKRVIVKTPLPLGDIDTEPASIPIDGISGLLTQTLSLLLGHDGSARRRLRCSRVGGLHVEIADERFIVLEARNEPIVGIGYTAWQNLPAGTEYIRFCSQQEATFDLDSNSDGVRDYEYFCYRNFTQLIRVNDLYRWRATCYSATAPNSHIYVESLRIRDYGA